MRIFVSFAEEDGRFSQFLERVEFAFTKQLGALFVFTNPMHSSGRWTEKVEQALSECDVFLLLWSKNAAKSPFVLAEIEAATKLERISKQPEMIILLLDDTLLPIAIEERVGLKWPAI
jgi:hypothetical protein